MNKKNKILWISGISWLMEDNSYFPKASYPGIVSGSAFQQAIIEGLEDQDFEIDILTDCDMGSGNRIEWSHNNKSKDIRIAGNKNKILRIPTKIVCFFKELCNEEYLKNYNYVIAYEMHLPYLFCLNIIKNKFPNIKTILICPDLSLFMDLNAKNKRIKKFLKSVENVFMQKMLKKVDGYVLFTRQMYQYFKKYNKKYVVVEGVYRDKYSLKEVNKKMVILHAGSLQHNVGIEELISAFNSLDNKNIELWFFGSGGLDEYIKQKSKENSKIKHMGFVDPKELFEYEKQATILVNVRNTNEEYTKYSFPSKTFEYLASGTIFMSTKLIGIPQEYYDYIYCIEDNSPKSIKEGIETILNMSDEERKIYGEKARDFVLNKKNKMVQSKKISDFIEKL